MTDKDKAIEEIVYLGNYIQDVTGGWWKMFPDRRAMVSEEISDLLNFHKAEVQKEREEVKQEVLDLLEKLQEENGDDVHKGLSLARLAVAKLVLDEDINLSQTKGDKE